MSLIVVIVLVLLMLGLLPSWPYSAGWGYYPSGIVGVILVVLVIAYLLGGLNGLGVRHW